MLRNYLATALRRLRQRPAYAFINVFGLAAGLACGLLILLFVQDELSYDRFHTKADRIFRIVVDVNTGGRTFSGVPAPWGPTLQAEEPAVEAAARFITFAAPVIVRHGERSFPESRFFWADSSTFRIFDYAFVRGNPATALAAPFSIVLTEAVARKYFGDEDPVGQTLRIDEQHDYQITGVLQQPPANTHLPFDFLASFASLEDVFADQPRRLGWAQHDYYTYLLLRNADAAPQIEASIPAFVARHASERLANVYERVELEPLTEIYLHSERDHDVGPRSDPSYARIFSAIALFILLIAAINFVNLTTARSGERAKEVGVRKAMGAGRLQLVRQFLGESVLMAVLGGVLALGMAAALLPLFNEVAGKSLAQARLFDPRLLAGLAAATLFVGVVAGLYPAVFLSRPQPARVLKAGTFTPSGGALFRKVLVVFQFTISVFLIASTLIIFSQLLFVQNKPLGFDKEQLVVIPMQDRSLRERYPVIKDAFRQHPNVLGVAASSAVPGALIEQTGFRPEGLPDEDPMTLPLIGIDYDYVEVLGLDLAAGRNVAEAFPSDAEQAFLVNEALVERLGWEDPVGKRLTWVRRPENLEGQVVGVVRDFHTASLRHAIDPVVLHILPARFNFFTVRLGAGDAQETMVFLEKEWRRLQPGWPFEYRFLDDDFLALHETEERLGLLATTFAALAILIACLGLFGLAAFTAERRLKEIGIRKVLGATVPHIVRLLSKEFLLLVGLAVLLATPLTYFAMQRWLEDFAYRVDISPAICLLSGSLALAIAFLTISYRALKAAYTDPVAVLRYE